MGFLYRVPIKLTLAQSVQIALLDAWLDELSGIIGRMQAKEPQYRVLSRLWPNTETLYPLELDDPIRKM